MKLLVRIEINANLGLSEVEKFVRTSLRPSGKIVNVIYIEVFYTKTCY